MFVVTPLGLVAGTLGGAYSMLGVGSLLAQSCDNSFEIVELMLGCSRLVVVEDGCQLSATAIIFNGVFL